MRTIDSRKLKALGYQAGDKLKFSGLEVICLESQSGENLLLVRNVLLGPGWPQIHKLLVSAQFEPRLLSLGSNQVVLVEDLPDVRRILETAALDARSIRQTEVHIDDIGFVALEEKISRKPKHLFLPALSVVFVIVTGILWGSIRSSPEEVQNQVFSPLCIVDASRADFESWLSSSLGSEQVSKDQVLDIDTELGKLQLVVEETIGSAARVTGVAVCDDGRELIINHRVDTSGTGVVLELGQ